MTKKELTSYLLFTREKFRFFQKQNKHIVPLMLPKIEDLG